MRRQADVMFWLVAVAVAVVILMAGGKWLAAQF
jgi:hypothetical protein